MRKLKDNKYREEIQDVFKRILRNSKTDTGQEAVLLQYRADRFHGRRKDRRVSDYLSTMFDMRLVEMDQEIAEREEMSIPDIFATYGEEYFRNLETSLLKELQTGRELYYILRRRGGAQGRECQLR